MFDNDKLQKNMMNMEYTQNGKELIRTKYESVIGLASIISENHYFISKTMLAQETMNLLESTELIFSSVQRFTKSRNL